MSNSLLPLDTLGAANSDSAHIALPALIDRASKALLSARTSAEILEAKMLGNVAYSASAMAARMGKAKKAHDTVVAAVGWIDPWQVDYYTGVAVDIQGRLVNEKAIGSGFK